MIALNIFPFLTIAARKRDRKVQKERVLISISRGKEGSSGETEERKPLQLVCTELREAGGERKTGGGGKSQELPCLALCSSGSGERNWEQRGGKGGGKKGMEKGEWRPWAANVIGCRSMYGGRTCVTSLVVRLFYREEG